MSYATLLVGFESPFWNSRGRKIATASRNVKMARPVLFMLLLVFLVGVVSAGTKPEAWIAEPKFSIENRSYTETLIFISGISYALTSSDAELRRSAKQNFFCLNAADAVGSKLLIDIINEKHSGSITSEQAIDTIVQGLKKRYPCK